MEIFKTIDGFDDYEISNFGRIKTKSRKVRYVHSVSKNEFFRVTESRFMKVYENKLTGYKHIVLRSNNKPNTLLLHSLVAKNFIEKTSVYFDTINHKDGNKHNNCVENLEWCTNKYNHEHATSTGLKAKGTSIGSSKLNDNCVHAIKYFLKKGFSMSELSLAFNISRVTISLISENKSWKHVALTNEELTIT